MDENNLKARIRKVRDLYDKNKYEKALSRIEGISGSELSSLDVEQQTNFTILQSLIFLKLEKYYESFRCILLLFVKTPFEADLITKTKEIFSQEGIHSAIYANLPLIKTEKITTFLALIQKVQDASEKGRCLMILYLSTTKNYAYYDYLVEVLYKEFPTNGFLRAEINKKEKLEEDEVHIKKEKEDVESVREFKETSREEYEDLFNKGVIACKHGDFQEGLDYYKQAHKLVDDDPELFCNMGGAFLKLGDLEKGKSWLNHALSLDPYKPLTLLNLAAAFSLEGRYDEAIQKLELLIKYNPDYQQAFPLLMRIKRQKELFDLLDVEGKNIPIEAINLFKKGVITAEQGKLSEAFTIIKAVIREYPQFAKAYEYMGVLEKEAKNQQTAFEYFNKALDLDPNLSTAWVQKGVIYDSQGLYKKAIECYEKAIELNPTYSASYNNKGLALASLGMHEEAINYYNKSIELNPDYEGAYNNRATSYKKINQNERALADYMKILELNPRDDYIKKKIDELKPHIAMGVGLTMRSVNDARDYCPRCGNKNYVYDEKCPYCRTPMYQENIEDMLQKLIEFEDLGDFEEAIIKSIRINQRKPTLAEAWFYRAKAHAALGEFETATLCLQKSNQLGISDDFFEKYSYRVFHNLNDFKNPNLSKAYLANLDVEENLESEMTQYGISDPNEKLWSSLGANYQICMEYEKAYKCYQNALEINENYIIARKNVKLIEKLAQKKIIPNPINFFKQGIVLCGQNRLEEAIEYFDKALELDPNYKAAWYYKALTLNQIGRFEEAVQFYDNALVVDPNYKDAWNSKGISLANLGRHKEALQAYNNAIDIDPNYKDAWNNKGIELNILGKLEEALKAYDRVLEMDPYFSLAWKNKELALKQAGRYEEARKVHASALKFGIF